MDTVVEQVSEFIGGHAGQRPENIEDDIFARGIVSSVFAVNILAWIERTFDVEVRSEDLMIDNFRTVRSIAEFVERKRSPGAG